MFHCFKFGRPSYFARHRPRRFIFVQGNRLVPVLCGKMGGKESKTEGKRLRCFEFVMDHRVYASYFL
jgi:hypothetical protein